MGYYGFGLGLGLWVTDYIGCFRFGGALVCIDISMYSIYGVHTVMPNLQLV